MTRMTRAKAAEVAEKLHVDENAVLELDVQEGDIGGLPGVLETPLREERRPLGEIAPNSGSGQEHEVVELRKSVRERNEGKRGAKGKKGRVEGSTDSQLEAEEGMPEVGVEEQEDAGSDGEIAGGLATDATGPEADNIVRPEEDAYSQAPESRLTRSQRTLEEAQHHEPERSVVLEDDASPDEAAPEPTSLHIDIRPAETVSPTPALTSPLPSATPKVIASLRKDNTGMRSTSNKENETPTEITTPVSAQGGSLTPRSASNYDALEAAVVEAATPPTISRRASAAEIQPVESSPKPAEGAVAEIEQPVDTPVTSPRALLAEEVAPLSASIGRIEHPSDTPMASPPGPAEPVAPLSANIEIATSPKADDPIMAMDALDEALEKVASEVPQIHMSPAKVKSKKPAPVVRTTKASLARLPLAQGEKAVVAPPPAMGRPRPSTALGRSNSIRQSLASKGPTGPTKRVPSTTTNTKKPTPNPTTETNRKPKTETTIPHSKPRPVSLSFPTPPPPPKSKKAPTTSSFQLPGEAIAARLKAAREERMRKEAPEEGAEKKAAFKARPAPTGKKSPSVRQTNASKGRESIVGGGRPAGSVPGLGLKRGSSVTASTSTAAPRARAAPPSAAPGLLRPDDKGLKVTKRPSTALANTTTNPRIATLSLSTSTSTNPNPNPNTARPSTSGAAIPTTTTQRVLSKGTAKSKEVFQRAAFAKEAAEREKREKEFAAKQARVQAAERSRVASREWAEKQRMKKFGGGDSGVKAEGC